MRVAHWYDTKQSVVLAAQSNGTVERVKDMMEWINEDGKATAFQYDPIAFPGSFILRPEGSTRIYSVREGDYVVKIGRGDFFVMDGYSFQEMYKGEWDKV